MAVVLMVVEFRWPSVRLVRVLALFGRLLITLVLPLVPVEGLLVLLERLLVPVEVLFAELELVYFHTVRIFYTLFFVLLLVLLPDGWFLDRG